MFDNFYHRIFPDLVRIEIVTDIALQKKGIDKILYLDNGQKIAVDEKKRRSNYGDILIELWSVYEHKIKGWLFTSHCHYIVYAIMPIRKAYLLPTILLRQAWRHNEHEWREQYHEIKAINPTYTTISIAIPPDILLPAIQKEIEHDISSNVRGLP
jgi:hypothetical protein